MNLVYWVLFVSHLMVGVTCAFHALLNKRDARSALGWFAVCLGYPLLGPIIYCVFGMNRVQTRARRMHLGRPTNLTINLQSSSKKSQILISHYTGLWHVGDALTLEPLLEGNAITLLHNGEEAYPSMLAAINAGKQRVYLSTYIFDSHKTGQTFVQALKKAKERGCDVKVIVDGVGERYAYPPISRLLNAAGIPVVRFHRPRLLPPSLYLNLRNHRKILVIDNQVGFTGGMNIGDRHLANKDAKRRVIDTHCRFEGPIVQQMEAIFIECWERCTQETITPLAPTAATPGNALCRVIADGPNETCGKISMLLVSAIASARNTIWIMTPYFLPSNELMLALQTAKLRGIRVNIILPKKNNLPYVHWATQHILPRLLQFGVVIYFQPAPFVHTKMFVVDDYYAIIGSANIDQRSLRLNFEMVVEIYDETLPKALAAHCQDCVKRSTQVTQAGLHQRPFFIKIRDALVWLFSPYL